MVLRTTLRISSAAILGATLLVATPSPAHAAARPVDMPAEVAVAVRQAVVSVAGVVVRVVRGDTSWGLAARRCGSGAAYQRGVVVRSPSGAVRTPAAIWPGDTATITCGSTTTRTAAPTAAGGWVAPLAGTLTVYGDCKVGGQGGHYLAQRNGHLHQGVDFGRGSGTAIRAVRSGTVTINKWGSGAGWYVTLNHGGGVRTVYMHLRSRSFVAVGARVGTGQTIGYVGSTGHSSGPHLHFEVRVGGGFWPASTNPSRFLRAHGVRVGGC